MAEAKKIMVVTQGTQTASQVAAVALKLEHDGYQPTIVTQDEFASQNPKYVKSFDAVVVLQPELPEKKIVMELEDAHANELNTELTKAVTFAASNLRIARLKAGSDIPVIAAYDSQTQDEALRDVERMLNGQNISMVAGGETKVSNALKDLLNPAMSGPQ